ncbi:hypothetical protein GTU79_10935 [Sodalis ligni]|jgi:membrane protein DedA with SNARE-associated domain|uniref:Membrane protein DedA with SNARE-associated domain n=1 Tax=Sodalis ligni TaxID=2697027 RepID=A0A4R1N9M3_9GAMM|nr:hypothetical protein [Sodalis ligni]QWA13121.1 hypothetical protein GTU79_10935 [Sodalis ligni]TCL03339.1 membrane protein DedA with SNARE-associated domain [Sodalis ligni]
MPEWMLSAISNYGYAALFVAALIEGPMATLFGAILASQGLLHLGGVYAIAVAGDLAGDLILYGLGMSGRIAILPWRRRIDFGRWQPAPLLERFRAHPGRILVTAKLTHAAGFVVLVSAGAARIPLWRFLGFNLLATLPKSGLFVLLGFFAGAAWQRIDLWLWIFSCSFLAVFCITLVVYLRRITGSVLPGG